MGAKLQTASIYPKDGGVLKIGVDGDSAGTANYRAKINIHRVGGIEEVVAGWGWFPGKFEEPAQMFVGVDLMGGTREIIACCATKLYRWREGGAAWDCIGSGFSEKGHRWECEQVGNYAIFNNGHDLPVCYMAGSGGVVPIYELREQGIARVGCIGSKGGMIICGDITEISPEYLDRWFNGGYEDAPTSGWTTGIGSDQTLNCKGVSLGGVLVVIGLSEGECSLWFSMNHGKTWARGVDESSNEVAFPYDNSSGVFRHGNTAFAWSGKVCYVTSDGAIWSEQGVADGSPLGEGTFSAGEIVGICDAGGVGDIAAGSFAFLVIGTDESSYMVVKSPSGDLSVQLVASSPGVGIARSGDTISVAVKTSTSVATIHSYDGTSWTVPVSASGTAMSIVDYAGTSVLTCITSDSRVSVSIYRPSDGANIQDDKTNISDVTGVSAQVVEDRFNIYPSAGSGTVSTGVYSIPAPLVIEAYGNEEQRCEDVDGDLSDTWGDSVEANTKWSRTQEKADEAAASELVCMAYLWNTEQTCGSGYMGMSIPSGTYKGTTQEEADASAAEHLICKVYNGFAPNPDGKAVVELVHPSSGDVWLSGKFASVYDPMSEAYRTVKGLAHLQSMGELKSFPSAVGAGTVTCMVTQGGGNVIAFGRSMSAGGTRNMVRFKKTNGAVDGTFTADLNYGESAPGSVSYGVRCAYACRDGKIIIGGKFSSINGVEIYGLARLNADGTFDTSWRCDVTGAVSSDGTFWGAVNTIESFDGGRTIMVGGSFDYARGVWSPGVARVVVDDPSNVNGEYNNTTDDPSYKPGDPSISYDNFSSPFGYSFCDLALPSAGALSAASRTLYGSISKIVPIYSSGSIDGFILSGNISENYHYGQSKYYPCVDIGCVKISADGARDEAWTTALASVGTVPNDGYGLGSDYYWNSHPYFPAKMTAHFIDGSGRVYVTGNFTGLSGFSSLSGPGLAPRYVARLSAASGSLDSSWNFQSILGSDPSKPSTVELDENYLKLEVPDDEDAPTGYVSVFGGGHVFMAIDDDGNLYIAGQGITSSVNTVTATGSASSASGAVVWAAASKGELAPSLGFVTDAGALYTRGRNDYGQLGDGTTTDSSSFTKNGSSMKRVEFGLNHMVALSDDGKTIYSCGKNDYGQCGRNPSGAAVVSVITAVPGVTGIIKQIGAGLNFSACLTTGGGLWTWGRNNQGQLGIGSTTDQYAPQCVIASGVSAFACGDEFVVYVTADNSVYSFGEGGAGQLGYDGSESDNHSPHFVKTFSEEVIGVACGDQHVIITLKSGKRYGCGWAGHGQLGRKSTGTKLGGEVRVPTLLMGAGYATSNSTACATMSSESILSDQKLAGYGKNDYYQQAFADISAIDDDSMLGYAISGISVQTMPDGDRYILTGGFKLNDGDGNQLRRRVARFKSDWTLD